MKNKLKKRFKQLSLQLKKLFSELNKNKLSLLILMLCGFNSLKLLQLEGKLDSLSDKFDMMLNGMGALVGASTAQLIIWSQQLQLIMIDILGLFGGTPS